MHSVTYRTQMLRDCGLKLPEHTFYVDNLCLHEPLPLCEDDLLSECGFFTATSAEGQSVNEQIMIKGWISKAAVNYRMIEASRSVVYRGETSAGVYALLSGDHHGDVHLSGLRVQVQRRILAQGKAL